MGGGGGGKEVDGMGRRLVGDGGGGLEVSGRWRRKAEGGGDSNGNIFGKLKLLAAPRRKRG